MTLIDLAYKLRSIIEQAMESVDDETALEAVTLFPEWEYARDNAQTGNIEAIKYEFGFRVRYKNVLYRCITTHVAQEDWAPDIATSLWSKVLIPDEEVIYPWEQPDSTNPYMIGDRVSHNGKIWVSDINNNVWEPGVYGWTEVVE